MWDEELARVSQRWADQCMPGHDQRRNVGSGYDDVADDDQCMPGHKELIGSEVYEDDSAC